MRRGIGDYRYLSSLRIAAKAVEFPEIGVALRAPGRAVMTLCRVANPPIGTGFVWLKKHIINNKLEIFNLQISEPTTLITAQH
jgi:hypothetical protein